MRVKKEFYVLTAELLGKIVIWTACFQSSIDGIRGGGNSKTVAVSFFSGSKWKSWSEFLLVNELKKNKKAG